ncbi:MAG: hypothetical protein KAV44_11650 [Bacteroidales bacterium]|nr:hypothetical protein [Bacteroidales bacterium]
MKFSYRWQEKFLYFSNCHLIPEKLWYDIRKKYEKKEEKEEEKKNKHKKKSVLKYSYTFTPLIILPRTHIDLFPIKDNQDVILEFKTLGGSTSIVTSKAFWFPDIEPWNKLKHPSISLVLRRYFGIERPLLDKEDIPPDGWDAIEHDKRGLELLHRDGSDKSKMTWAVLEPYSHRFWLPDASNDKSSYYKTWQEGTFLEYCGISLKVRKRSFLLIK